MNFQQRDERVGPFVPLPPPPRRRSDEFASYTGWLRVLLALAYHEPWLKGTNAILGSRSCNEFSHRPLLPAVLLIASPLENSPSFSLSLSLFLPFSLSPGSRSSTSLLLFSFVFSFCSSFLLPLAAVTKEGNANRISTFESRSPSRLTTPALAVPHSGINRG